MRATAPSSSDSRTEKESDKLKTAASVPEKRAESKTDPEPIAVPVRATAPPSSYNRTEKESDKLETAAPVPEKIEGVKIKNGPVEARTGVLLPADLKKSHGKETTNLPEPKNVSFTSPFPIVSAPSDLASAEKLNLTKPADTTDLNTSATTPNLETLASP